VPWRCLDRPDEVRGSIAEQCGGGLPDVEGLSSSTKYAGLSPSTGLEVLSVGPPPRRSSLNPRSNHRPGGPPSPLPSKFFSNPFQGKFQYNKSTRLLTSVNERLSARYWGKKIKRTGTKSDCASIIWKYWKSIRGYLVFR